MAGVGPFLPDLKVGRKITQNTMTKHPDFGHRLFFIYGSSVLIQFIDLSFSTDSLIFMLLCKCVTYIKQDFREKNISLRVDMIVWVWTLETRFFMFMNSWFHAFVL